MALGLKSFFLKKMVDETTDPATALTLSKRGLKLAESKKQRSFWKSRIATYQGLVDAMQGPDTSAEQTAAETELLNPTGAALASARRKQLSDFLRGRKGFFSTGSSGM